ncbi:MAG: lamin tail domain-containing protein [Pirellulales bacterium]|nr:lamin tail domain-containing protein [Pirellulales bacterium]
MRVSRPLYRACAILTVVAVVTTASAQAVVINEIVKEQRTAGSGAFNPDDREFVELYNPGPTAVDIGDWSLVVASLEGGAPLVSDVIPTGTMLAPGGYFVIGAAGVPNVNYTPPGTTGIELYPDVAANAIELRDNNGDMVDAVAYEVFRLGATGLTGATADQLAQIGSGFQGQLISMNALTPNVPQGWSRYRDGHDSNSNGRDFGILPLTPGASNNLPLVPVHNIPDVDAMSVGTELSTQYHASFVLPRVVDPTATNAFHFSAIPASPQGGNAIIAWDETGGGNSIYSKELVSKFDLWAYFDTAPIGITGITNAAEFETTVYGIGTTDAFFVTPDPTNLVLAPTTVTGNSSTGIGWLYQRYEEPTGVNNFQKLMLVDFGDGGNSKPAAGEWNIIEEIDVSGLASGWFRLSIDYDAATGNVSARFGDNPYAFTTDADLAATFYVGYREGLTGVPGANNAAAGPPIFDLVPAAPPLDADFDDSTLVDGSDFLIWQRNNGTTSGATNSQGDADLDGDVDADDLAAWTSNYGQPQATAVVAAVPEPATAGLALLAGALVVAAARRRGA